MHVISTCSDVESLSNSNVFSNPYIKYLKEEFLGLFELLNGDENLVNFSLQRMGYMMLVLEHDDQNFAPIGLEPKLVNNIPEYVEIVDLGETRIYRIGIVLDNDSMTIIYSEIGILDLKSEKWLVEQSSISERGV